MKKVLIFLAIQTIAHLPLFAQYTEGEKPMTQGLKNALSFEIKDLKTSKVEDLWQDFVKQFDCKTKKDKKMDEYFSDNAKIYYIPSTTSIDIFANFAERGKNATEASIFFLDNDRFLSTASNAEQMKGATEFVRQFDIYVQKYQTKEQLEDEQKKLKKLESDLKKLIKDNENLHKDIENYKDKIKKAESDIVKNTGDQEKATQMINEQAKIMEQVKSKLDQLK